MRRLYTALLTVATAHAALAQEARPPEATEISEAEAREALAAGQLVLDDDAERAPDDDAEVLAAYFERQPEARAAYEAATRALGEGEPEVTIETRAGARSVPLVGAAGMTAELAGSLRQVAAPRTVLRTFELLYPVAAAAGLRVPTPAEAARWATADLRALNREILRRYDDIRPRHPEPVIEPIEGFPEASFDPQDYTHTPCVGGSPANLGSGQGGDMQTFTFQNPGCDVSPTGIFALDPRTYRNHLGCIKDQGRRGSCTAFATASALETAFSHASQQRLDLSEQSLYARMKLRQPLNDPKRSWDGVKTEEAIARLAAEQFTVSFESGWDYNPAHARQVVPGAAAPFHWEHSCDGYFQTCSDAVHQAERVCYRPSGPGLPVACGWITQTSNWGLRVEQPGLQLWDADDSYASVDAVKAALDGGYQVVLSLMVNQPFLDGVEGDGVVKYGGEDVGSKGFHAVHVVAYVDNTDLAEFAPGVPPGDYGKPGTQGEGGYLVVRNSWGPCAGDGGYLYLPYRWLKPYLFVTSAVAIAPTDMSPWMADQ